MKVILLYAFLVNGGLVTHESAPMQKDDCARAATMLSAYAYAAECVPAADLKAHQESALAAALADHAGRYGVKK